MPAKRPASSPPAESGERVFVLTRACAAGALAGHIPPGLRLQLGRQRELQRTYLDTQDWRLWAAEASLVAETSASQTWLQWRPPQAGPVTVSGVAVPRRAADLPVGTLAREIEPLLGERALLPLAMLRVRQRPGALQDEAGKILARLSWELAQPVDALGQPVGEPRRTLRVTALRGYEKAFRTVLNHLARAPFLRPVPDDELAWAAAARGRQPGDYTSRFWVPLSPDLPAGEASLLILRRLLASAEANLAGAVADLDAEFLHDLRVAVRRARSALGQLREALDQNAFAPLREELRWLGQVTGACRDMDVFLADLAKYSVELGETTAAQLGPLLDHLREERQRHHLELQTALTSARVRRTLALWGRLTRPPRRSQPPGLASQPVAEFAAVRVRRAFKRLRRHAHQLSPQARQEELHRLRIDGKKLRYLLEFFSSLWGPAGASLIRQLKELQDALGSYNDLAVQERRLAEGLAGLWERGHVSPETALAAGRLAALLGMRAQQQRALALTRLEEFVSADVAAQVKALGKRGEA